MAPVMTSTGLLLIAGLVTTVSGFLAPLHVKSRLISSHRSITPNRCAFRAEKSARHVVQIRMNTITDLTDEIQVLRNELVRKDAIIEGLLATLAKTAITTRLKPTVSSTPLTDLCQLTKEVRTTPHLLTHSIFAIINRLSMHLLP
jgi:hypothetical protein